MNTLSQRWRVAQAWLLSFVRREWQPEHYPIEVREQKDVPANLKWFARVLNWPGPSGLGQTAEDARAALLKALHEIAATRWSRREAMPRPGTKVPIGFASAARVTEDPELLDDFIIRALGFKAGDPVFISDLTSIDDFGDEDESARIRDRIRLHYGVEVNEQDSMAVADILVRIRASR